MIFGWVFGLSSWLTCGLVVIWCWVTGLHVGWFGFLCWANDCVVSIGVCYLIWVLVFWLVGWLLCIFACGLLLVLF